MTGLIYVAIVALWAAVLIPMWLRRHDDDQARRIERHRVAMGTLARISRPADDARGVAARRRRLVLAGAATVGALGSAAWIAGLVPGIVTLVLWLPFAVFLPATILAERSASVRSAELALEQRRERARERRASAREADVHVSEPIVAEPGVSAPRRMAPAPPAPRTSTAWDEVFDQTA